MRFLFIDAKYPAFLARLYGDTPELVSAPYAQQVDRIASGLFGEAQFQAAAIVALGHEADVVVTNAEPAQNAWAREHGVGLGTRRSLRFGLGQRLMPRRPAVAQGTNWEVVYAQMQAYRPDVIYVEIMDSIPAPVALELCSMARLSIAQIAAPVPAKAHRSYGLVLSSIPTMVDAFRAAGIDAEWAPLAFEPNLLNEIPARERDIAVSFVGSFAAGYPERTLLVDAVARRAPLDIWTGDPIVLGRSSAAGSVRGAAFGREMYDVLARSRITLNSHAVWAGPDANNLRLYEATGMGALLITDARRNLSDLFDVGREVVAYERPPEAAELVEYYIGHRDETSRIATAGQGRTLRDHTWMNRMAQVLHAVESRL